MGRDPDTDAEEALLEQIRRFPEQFPVSIGGLLPDAKAGQVIMDPLDPANIEPQDGIDEDDDLATHPFDERRDVVEQPYLADHPYDLEDED